MREDNQFRRVYMDVPHSANPKPSWYGELVGHYEGDTLVIDTIGLNDKTVVDIYRTPHTEKLHVVERWRMVDGGKVMEVIFTVEDPGRVLPALDRKAALSPRRAGAVRKDLRREQQQSVRLSHAGGGEAGLLSDAEPAASNVRVKVPDTSRGTPRASAAGRRHSAAWVSLSRSEWL